MSAICSGGHTLSHFKSSLKACDKNSSAKSSRGSKEICVKATEHVYAGERLTSSYHSFKQLSNPNFQRKKKKTGKKKYRDKYST